MSTFVNVAVYLDAMWVGMEGLDEFIMSIVMEMRPLISCLTVSLLYSEVMVDTKPLKCWPLGAFAHHSVQYQCPYSKGSRCKTSGISALGPCQQPALQLSASTLRLLALKTDLSLSLEFWPSG